MVLLNKDNLPGILVVIAVAFAAQFLGSRFPVVGGPILAIVLGLILSGRVKLIQDCTPGIRFCSRKLLQAAIVLLGAGINLRQIGATGSDALLVIGLVILGAYAVAYTVGRVMKLPLKTIALIGTGTAICGGTAIAALAPIIGAEDDDITFAITTIFLYNVAAVVLFPLAAYWLGMTDYTFGLWAGTAINDTSSVVAASYSFSFEAGVYATIVKLARTTAMIPVALIYSFLPVLQRTSSTSRGISYQSMLRTFPWFILFFLSTSLLNTAALIPAALGAFLVLSSRFLILMALAAVGMNADLKKMRRTGVRPLLLGGITWLAVSIISLATIYLFYSGR
jgi:uncharacterized integral membrane protein (TIGR00698 family)